LTAEIDLPAGVFWDGLAVVGDWTCDGPIAGSNKTANCTLTPPKLDPGATSTLQVAVHTNGNGGGGKTITAAFAADGLTVVTASTTLQIVSSLAFSSAVTADLVHAAASPIAFAVRNDGAAPAHGVTATVIVPLVVTFDASPTLGGESAKWKCIGSTTQPLAECTLLADLAPREIAPLVLYATANGATVDSVLVKVTDGPGADAPFIRDSVPLNIADAGLSVRYQSLPGAKESVTEVGAPLLGCDRTDAACRAAMAELNGSAQNNGRPMVPLTDSKGTLIDSVATLKIPADSGVVFAGLYWSANRYETDAWTGRLDEAKIRKPGTAEFVSVTGEVITPVLNTDSAGRSYYQSFADVTSIVNSGGAGDWAVRGAATSGSTNDTDPTYYAGWALVVVYQDQVAGGNVTVFDGGAMVRTGQKTTFHFGADAADPKARIGAVAWEGDRGNLGDVLTLDTADLLEPISLIPIRWDGSKFVGGNANDAFDSTATGSEFLNSLGTDAKAFRPAPLRYGINRLTASTTGDQYMIGVITLQTTAR
jgi:hypothetical protein